MVKMYNLLLMILEDTMQSDWVQEATLKEIKMIICIPSKKLN